MPEVVKDEEHEWLIHLEKSFDKRLAEKIPKDVALLLYRDKLAIQDKIDKIIANELKEKAETERKGKNKESEL